MILVNDRDKVEWKENMTVQDILDKMGYSYVLITVTVNEEYVKKDDYLIYKVKDNSKVTVFHLAHGG